MSIRSGRGRERSIYAHTFGHETRGGGKPNPTRASIVQHSTVLFLVGTAHLSGTVKLKDACVTVLV